MTFKAADVGWRLGRSAIPRGIELWCPYDRTTGVFGEQGSGKTLDVLAQALLELQPLNPMKPRAIPKPPLRKTRRLGSCCIRSITVLMCSLSLTLVAMLSCSVSRILLLPRINKKSAPHLG